MRAPNWPRGVVRGGIATQRPIAPAGCGLRPLGVIEPSSVNVSLGSAGPVQFVTAAAGSARSRSVPVAALTATLR